MTEKYILRNPIYLEPHDMPPEYFLWDYDSNPDGTVMEFSAKQVDELFMPLIRKASEIERLISRFFEDAVQTQTQDDFLVELLALVYGGQDE